MSNRSLLAKTMARVSRALWNIACLGKQPVDGRARLSLQTASVLVMTAICSPLIVSDSYAQNVYVGETSHWAGTLCSDISSCAEIPIDWQEPVYAKLSEGRPDQPYKSGNRWYILFDLHRVSDGTYAGKKAAWWAPITTCAGGESPPCDGYVAEPEEQPAKPCDETNPCNPQNGNKSQVERDYTAGAGVGLTFERYYNSSGAFKTASGMPIGWRHTYSREMNVEPDRVLNVLPASSSGSQSSVYPTASDACTSGWDEIKFATFSGEFSSATATFVGGNSCRITSGGSAVAYLSVRKRGASFNPDYGAGLRVLVRPDGRRETFELVNGSWINEFNPTVQLIQSGSNFIFTDSDDTEETYNASNQLISISRRNGQTETLAYDLSVGQGGDGDSSTLDRVTGAFGHTISFSYDGAGELITVTTPDGDIDYVRDSDSNLSTATYPDGASRSYLYEAVGLPNHLTGIEDENGDRFATWQYDGSGRAILSERAGGSERVELTYNADGTTTLNMANGAERIYTFATEQGQRKLSSLSGDVCSTCPGGNIKSRTYDSNGFLDEATDWEGNVTKTTRNSKGLVESLVEGLGSPEERTTTTSWHSSFRLPTQITTSKNVTDYTYDADGNLLTLTISSGGKSRSWTFTYNSNSQLLTIDGPRTDVSDVTTFEYYSCTTGGECGQLKKITNALGHVTNFDSYNASGRLTLMTDPNGLQTSYTYDDRGRPLTVTQSPVSGADRVTTMTYDAAGQLETLSTPDGMVLTYTYSDAHYLTSVTDNLGNRVEYDYDAMGKLTGEDTYDPSSFLTRAVDYAHDLNYRLDTVTNGGFTTDLTFDLVGNLTQEEDPNSNTTQHTYDALNRLDNTIDALTGVTDYDYDDHDNLTQVVAANGATTAYVYDDLDSLLSESSPDRGLTSYTYDDAGNMLTRTDARGITATYTYDALNRVTSVSFPTSSENVTYSYDNAATEGIGRLSSMTDQSGTTTYAYDEFGRVVSDARLIAGSTFTTTYQYDTAGNVTSITYPSGRTVNYVRDVLGNIERITSNKSGTVKTIVSSAAYEPFGPVTSLTYGNGVAFDYTFDDGYRTIGITSSATTGKAYGYDSAGNIIAISDSINPSQGRLFEYDALNRIVSDAQTSHPDYQAAVLSDNPLVYWRLGESSGTVAADASAGSDDGVYVGAVSLGASGLVAGPDTGLKIDVSGYYGGPHAGGPTLTGVTPTGIEAWFQTNSPGSYRSIISLHRSNTERAILAHNADGTVGIYRDMTDYALTSDGVVSINEPHHVAVWYESSSNTSYLMIDGVLQQETYTGNVLAITDPILDVAAYRYNGSSYASYWGVIDEVAVYNTPVDSATFAEHYAAGQLSVSGIQYAYDGNGNRTSITSENTVTPYDYEASSNRLNAIAGASVQLDAAGNQIADQSGNRTFSYDDGGRLVEVRNNGNLTASYVHNALGQRVRKTAGSTDVVYTYDIFGNLLSEFTAAGAHIRDYVWMDGVPVAQVDSGETFAFLHFDHLGTPRWATDDAQTVVWRWDSDAFGSSAANDDPDGNGTPLTINLRFPGQYFDVETGFHYNYFRTYDPSTGRYLESDPIGLWGGTNTYEYVYSNPLIYYDPYGLWAFGDPLPQGLVDFSTGFGDTISLGATSLYRDWRGIDGGVNKCSKAYSAGEWTGIGFGLAAGGAGLARGGLRFELGNWKQGGQWFFREGTRGPHFHYGSGAGLQSHHLPYQARNWFNNLRSLVRRGEGGRDLGNLGLVGYGAAVPASSALRDNDCECSE